MSVDDRINQNGNVGVSNDRFALGSLFRLRPRIPSISAALPDQTPWDGQATGGSCCSHHARFKGGLCGWKSVGLWVNVQKTLEKLGLPEEIVDSLFLSRESLSATAEDRKLKLVADLMSGFRRDGEFQSRGLVAVKYSRWDEDVVTDVWFSSFTDETDGDFLPKLIQKRLETDG